MNIPTYNGSLPADFNWFAVLKDLSAGAELTSDDHLNLIALANQWPSCACGQLCLALPRSGNGHRSYPPKDSILRAYGVDFARHIEKKRWDLALKTMYSIERRTIHLLGIQ